MLAGARHVTLGGRFAYVAADAGLVIVDLDDPLKPKLAAVVPLQGVRASRAAVPLPVRRRRRRASRWSTSPIRTSRGTSRRRGCRWPTRAALYVARTYAYVAAGSGGPRDRRRRAAGSADALHEVHRRRQAQRRARRDRRRPPTRRCSPTSPTARTASRCCSSRRPTSSPSSTASRPSPSPQLIAWRNTATPAHRAVARASTATARVDETGDQIAVFGRIGSRPFTWDEMKRFYLKPDGSVYTVTDDVRMQDFKRPPATAAAPAAMPRGKP